jgi:putative transposase
MTLTHSGASELAQLMVGTTAGALIPEIVRRVTVAPGVVRC